MMFKISHQNLHLAKTLSDANYKTSCVVSFTSLVWKTLVDKMVLKNIPTFDKLLNFCILYACN